jgi:Tfp pilus assembly protein PilF
MPKLTIALLSLTVLLSWPCLSIAATDPKQAAQQMFQQGVGFIRQQQLDQAIDRFQQAIVLDPQLVPAQYNLGLALRQKGDIQGAASAFYRTIQAKPDWAVAYANLGAALLEGRNFPQAQEYLERAIVLDPQSAIGHYNLGLVYHQQQNPQQARPALTTAKQLYDRQNNRAGAALAQKWLDALQPNAGDRRSAPPISVPKS